MYLRNDFTDTETARRSELAAILARAALRLHARAALPPPSAHVAPTGPLGEKSPKSLQTGLDLSADRSVHGHLVDNPGDAP